MIEFKLVVNDNNDCEVIKPAGQDFVRTCVCEGEAKAIIATASKVESSDKFEGFGICVNDGAYFIAGTLGEAKAKAEPKSEPEEKPAEPKKRGGRPKKSE